MSLLFKRHGDDFVPGYEPGHISVNGRYVPTSEEVTAYQNARDPWDKSVRFGYYTLAFLCPLLLLFIITNGVWLLRVRYRRPFARRLSALCRLATYPRLPRNISSKVDLIWTTTPLGPSLITIAGLIVSTCICFVNKYQYFLPFYGSSPLYLRAEWIALAMMPFVYMLGAKRNFIGALTGVSHEKLQALHQTAAVIFVYMGLVHSIVACVRASCELGVVLTTKTDAVFMSGFVALAPMLMLLIGALPPFRKYAYETFLYVHIIMAIFFLAALFWHGYGLLDNDAYCIATIVLLLISVFWRCGMMLLNNPTLHRARIQLLSEGSDTITPTIRITIPTRVMQWKAGQHVFLRFLAVRPMESHPFTIANVSEGTFGDERVMTFVVRAKSGFTSSLANAVHASGGKDNGYAVLIDGPYGVDGGHLAAFQHVVLCIGGSGMSWAMGVLQHLQLAAAAGHGPVSIRLVWAVRDIAWVSWFEAQLAALPLVKVDVYLTGNNMDRSDSGLSEKGMDDSPKIDNGETGLVYSRHGGRPDFPAIIASQLAEWDGSVGIGACGPTGLITDVANAAANAQKDILRGRSAVDEVFLATECYGW